MKIINGNNKINDDHTITIKIYYNKGFKNPEIDK